MSPSVAMSPPLLRSCSSPLLLHRTTMMMHRQKYHVIFEGRSRGIYDSWEWCQALVYRYKGTLFRSFDSFEAAEYHMNEYLHDKYGVQGPAPEFKESQAVAVCGGSRMLPIMSNRKLRIWSNKQQSYYGFGLGQHQVAVDWELEGSKKAAVTRSN
ncbi:hypothetical protein EJ110_NYTH20841 [Nymphaea thermarum]|nr:hypothetical protein EJ110_NYTH20841 [Nymphaea thermarum]